MLGNPSFSLAGVTNGGQAQREREASHVLHRHARAGCVDEYMAASWYKRRHRYIDNQRVKLKIVLPTTDMAKLAIDSASLDCLFTLEINREIFIPNREVGRFSLLRKQSGVFPPNREAGKLCVFFFAHAMMAGRLPSLLREACWGLYPSNASSLLPETHLHPSASIGHWRLLGLLLAVA